MAQLPNGATVEIASALSAAIIMSAVSNETPAVATLAASHGVVTDDILLITSGWTRLNNRVAKAGTVSTNDVDLAGFDTSDTDRYPAAGGAGSVQKVSGWTQLTEVNNVANSGGDQQYASFQFLEDDDERQLPSVRSAETIEFQLADGPSLPWYATVDAADVARTTTVMRINLRNGTKLYYPVVVSLKRTPTLNVNQIMTLNVPCAMQALLTRYNA